MFQKLLVRFVVDDFTTDVSLLLARTKYRRAKAKNKPRGVTAHPESMWAEDTFRVAQTESQYANWTKWGRFITAGGRSAWVLDQIEINEELRWRRSTNLDAIDKSTKLFSLKYGLTFLSSKHLRQVPNAKLSLRWAGPKTFVLVIHPLGMSWIFPQNRVCFVSGGEYQGTFTSDQRAESDLSRECPRKWTKNVDHSGWLVLPWSDWVSSPS